VSETYEVKNYNSFDSATGTINNYSTALSKDIETISTCNEQMNSDSICMGPVFDSCKDAITNAITRLNNITNRNTNTSNTINQISDNYQTGDKAASDTVTSVNADGSNYQSALSSINTPTKEEIINKATSMGYSEDYIKTIIGTAQNEGYVDDPYLYYGWSSVMLNNPVSSDVVYGWGGGNDYYSQANILNGYEIASDDVLKSVYLALTSRNTNIAECDGMYSSTPAGYSVLYDSPVYNCTVYEKS